MDMILSALLFGAGYYDYMWFDFAELSLRERNCYLTRLRNKRMNEALNQQNEIPEDKYKFYLLFREYMKRDVIEAESDWETFRQFMEGKTEYILKPRNGGGGHGVELITLDSGRTYEEVYAEVRIKKEYLLEEHLIQHPALSKLNTSSINTYRIVTICMNGCAHLLYASIRMGRAGSCTDNIGTGGIVCSLDTQKGCISSTGYDNDTNEYTVHPDSGIPLKGYPLPYVRKAVCMCLEAARRYETYGVRLVGWDVAVLEDDVELIESNNYPAYELWQRKGFQDGKRPLGIYPYMKKVIKQSR